MEAGLCSSDAFTLRRSQILLAFCRGERPARIAHNLGCAVQTVRNTIRAYDAEGGECLRPKHPGPKQTHPIFDEEKREELKALLHRSPRDFGKQTSVWTLEIAAEVCAQSGLTERLVSDETVRMALRRLGVGWRRAKNWITSPDPEYVRKKTA
ncbi:MAG: helix-turn-helix domain-containing protein [Chloroflexia bacterium]